MSEEKKPKASAKVRWAARLFILLFCLGLGEVGARIAGHKPWNPNEGRNELFIVVPGPSQFLPDEEIGHSLNPGMHMITYGYGTALSTHLDRYRRLTRPYDMPPPAADAKTLWFFGDSFTYGGSISDQEAYPYRVQVKHPELSVVDYAFPGQSTVQTLLLLKKLLSSGVKPPTVAFMGYASFHDGRTLMARGNMKGWHYYRTRYPNFPAARLEDGQLVIKWIPMYYDALPLEEHSALVNLFSVYYNKADVVRKHGREVAQALIEQIDALCKANGTRFVLLGVGDDARSRLVIDWASAKGIQSADISVNLTKPENIVYGDGHPSGKATIEMTEKLEPVIAKALASLP
jgi:hypothetical protein